MAEAGNDSISEKVAESGTRRRGFEWIHKGVFGDCHNRLVCFGQFAISLSQTSMSMSTFDISIKCLAPFQGILFAMGRDFQPWSAQFTVKVTTMGGRLIEQASFLLHNDACTSILIAEQFINFECRIRFDIESVEGLGVGPLRDYAVPDLKSDVTLVVENKQFCLQKAFLAGHSSFFATLLFGDFAEKDKNVIELKDIPAEAFTDLLDTLTHNFHHLPDKDRIFAVLALADRYDVFTVPQRIQNVLLLAPDSMYMNIGEMLWVADKHNMTTLLSRCLHGWKPADAIYMTEKMHSELSRCTSYTVFRKNHVSDSPVVSSGKRRKLI